MLRLSLLHTLVSAGMLLVAPHSFAQRGGPRIPDIVIAGESPEAATRLRAADRLVGLSPSPEVVARVTALSGLGLCNLIALASFAADHTSRQDWSVALAEYQRLIYNDGDTLVRIEDDLSPTVQSLPVRRLCHARIWAAPPSALELYRRRTQPLAEKLLRAGIEGHDVRPLYRLIEDLLCSSCGVRAADFLGDLAFEDGRFDEAAQWWRLIVAVGADPALLSAKIILAQAFQSERSATLEELKAFRAVHAGRRGKLAGQEGEYATIIENLIRHLPDPRDEKPWSTYAGNPARNRVSAANPSPRLWAEGPAWKVALPKGVRERSWRWSYPQLYPLISGNRVLLADQQSITAYDLFTGRHLFRYRARQPALLSISDNRIYACLRGGPGVTKSIQHAGLQAAVKRETEESRLVCLKVTSSQDNSDVCELWSVPRHDGARFLSGPLVHDGRVYIVTNTSANRQDKLALECYDAGGALTWRVELCDYDTPASGGISDQPWLTLAADHIVCCTHAGAILAVHRTTGKRAWAVRYPVLPNASEAIAARRHPCPAIFHNGRIFAAPVDTHHILCLDASSGELLWDRDEIQPDQLLGVASRRLVFTTSAGLAAFDAHTGSWEGGWQQPSGPGRLPSMGRGLLAGQWVFWPTRSAEFPTLLLTTDSGDIVFEPTQTRRILPGNMAFGNGCLVVAGVNELATYVPPEPRHSAKAAAAHQP